MENKSNIFLYFIFIECNSIYSHPYWFRVLNSNKNTQKEREPEIGGL